MSFDLFLVAADSVEEAARVLREKDFDRAATAQEEVRMHRVVCRVLQISPDAVVQSKAGGFSNGLWVGNSRFPDLDVYPSYIFCSFKTAAHGADIAAICELLSLFEELGYIAFDPQSGRFVDSATFCLADPVSGQQQAPLRPAQPRRWWKPW